MPKYEIQIARERCTGCLRCALACSDLYTKRFNPSMSRVRIFVADDDSSVDLTEECNHCGVCADHCLYGAIRKTRREGDG